VHGQMYEDTQYCIAGDTQEPWKLLVLLLQCGNGQIDWFIPSVGLNKNQIKKACCWVKMSTNKYNGTNILMFNEL
jgi:hypothetical protein